MKNLTELWQMVNSAQTLDQVYEAEAEIRKNTEISNDDFDELMMSLAYISRECYHEE